MTPMSFSIKPLGFISTPFKQKFAIPRQPRIVPDAIGKIRLSAPHNNIDLLRDIQQFSHIWLLFCFHQNINKGWRPTVRPPRLGGNQRTGVLATRSTFRPNHLGMSAVELLAVEGTCLTVGGVDLVDGTPIIDIKPYLPYTDSIPQATAGYAELPPSTKMQIEFSETAHQQCQQQATRHQQLRQLICQLLQQDPRPAYKQSTNSTQTYGMMLYDLQIRWTVNGNVTQVLSITAN